MPTSCSRSSPDIAIAPASRIAGTSTARRWRPTASRDYSYAIAPGLLEERRCRAPGRDINRWHQNVRDIVASGAPWQLVATFNEWGEGTSVESAREWETGSGYGAYLDALHNNGNGTPAQPTATNVPGNSNDTAHGDKRSSHRRPASRDQCGADEHHTTYCGKCHCDKCSTDTQPSIAPTTRPHDSRYPPRCCKSTATRNPVVNPTVTSIPTFTASPCPARPGPTRP